MTSLLGAWKLLEAVVRRPGRDDRHPYGKEAKGLLVYEPGGVFSAQIMGSDRPSFALRELGELDAPALRSALLCMVAYYGSWALGEGGTVVHRVEGSWVPAWEQGEQIRSYLVEDERLTLSAPWIPARPAEATFVATWERLPLAG